METLNPTHTVTPMYNNMQQDSEDEDLYDLIDEEGEDEDTLNNSTIDIKLKKQHPFNKGMLDFDDFNY